MTALPVDEATRDQRPLAEPGTRRGGADVGGVLANAPARDRSVEAVESVDSATDRSATRRTDTVAPDGNASSGHDPDEPPDEGPIESLGRSVSEVVTGPLEDGENRDVSTGAP